MESQYYQGKNIWIIGASEGIGRALTLALSDLGATLILSARSAPALHDLNQQLKKTAIIAPLDVAQADDFHATTAFILNLQVIDMIIYLPGYYQPGPLQDMQDDVIDTTLAINLRSVFTLLQCTLDYLVQHPTCQLAVFASSAGYLGLPNAQPYAATKAAVINLLESAQAEYPQAKLRLINPGFVKTRLTDKNKFYMPALLSAPQAADAVLKALMKNNFEIHFPKRLTLVLKLLKILPYSVYFYLLNKIKKR